jgi:microcystin-dependent protein
LLGTTYGGDGVKTFGIPNLQGRVPVHFGQYPDLSNRNLGDVYGEENHTLLTTEMPAHNHVPQANPANATSTSPSSNVWAQQPGGYLAYGPAGGAAMRSGAIAPAGNSQPHPNMQPYLVLNFCIALQGVFPSRN